MNVASPIVDELIRCTIYDFIANAHPIAGYAETFGAEPRKHVTGVTAGASTPPTNASTSQKRAVDHISTDKELDSGVTADPLSDVSDWVRDVLSVIAKMDSAAGVNEERNLQRQKAYLKRELRAFDVSFERVTGHAPSRRDKEPIRDLYLRYKDIKRRLDVRHSDEDRGEKLPQRANENDFPMTVSEEDLFAAQLDGPDDVPEARGPHLRALSQQPSAASEQPNVKDPVLPRSVVDAEDMVSTSVFEAGRFKHEPGLAKRLEEVVSTAVNGLRSGSISAQEAYRSLRACKHELKVCLHGFESSFVREHKRPVRLRADRSPFQAEYDLYKTLKQQVKDMEP